MNELLDISNKIDDPAIIDLLSELSAVTGKAGIPFLVIGATARDIVLWYGFGIRPSRATQDIDIGIRVESWDEYSRFRKALYETGKFVKYQDKQRVMFNRTLPLDILPFGAISEPNAKIEWQPADGCTLNVLGFSEAYDNALLVRISDNPVLDVKMTSPAGLVLLKLFAWSDRKPGSKDAIDLGILIRSYMKLGNSGRIYQEHSDLLAMPDFDYDLAGARILGRDLAVMCGNDIRDKLLAILNTELDADGNLPLVVKSAADSRQIGRTLEFWTAIRDELAVAM